MNDPLDLPGAITYHLPPLSEQTPANSPEPDKLIIEEELEPSKGHVAFGYGSEFFHGPDGVLYRAPISCPLGLDGYRQGARFECQPRSDGHTSYLKTAYPAIS